MLFFWSLPNPFRFVELLIIIKVYCHLAYKALCAQSPSHVQLSAASWTVAYQAPLPMEFFRQQYWSRLPFSYASRSSQPRDRNCVSCIFCIGRKILYHWATREAPILGWILDKRPRSKSNITVSKNLLCRTALFSTIISLCYTSAMSDINTILYISLSISWGQNYILFILYLWHNS